MNMKGKVALVFLIGLLLSSCLADLRPKEKGVALKVKGEILLYKAAANHGYSAYSRLKSYELMVQDSFIGIIGKQAHC